MNASTSLCGYEDRERESLNFLHCPLFLTFFPMFLSVLRGHSQWFANHVADKKCSPISPTTDDKLRLGDTNLYARIEKDDTVYGDECVFGGGKVIREGMGQGIEQSEALSLDTVITNSVIIDYSGIYIRQILALKMVILSVLGKQAIQIPCMVCRAICLLG